MVEFLIEEDGIDLNAVDDYRMTALHHAVKLDCIKICYKLLMKKAKTDIPDCEGMTAKELALTEEFSLVKHMFVE